MVSPKGSDILRIMKRKNTEQAPTPETDAVAFDAFDGQGGDEVVFANLARRFERERNKAEAGWLECRNFAQQIVDERDEAREALDCLLAVVGLTPISGNKEALQEAVDKGRAVLRKREAAK